MANQERIYIYKRYERFWHWSQALLVIVMMITGFEIHGTYSLLGFGRAVQVHTMAAWALITLWAFTIFWQFTTGESSGPLLQSAMNRGSPVVTSLPPAPGASKKSPHPAASKQSVSSMVFVVRIGSP